MMHQQKRPSNLSHPARRDLSRRQNLNIDTPFCLFINRLNFTARLESQHNTTCDGWMGNGPTKDFMTDISVSSESPHYFRTKMLFIKSTHMGDEHSIIMDCTTKTCKGIYTLLKLKAPESFTIAGVEENIPIMTYVRWTWSSEKKITTTYTYQL